MKYKLKNEDLEAFNDKFNNYVNDDVCSTIDKMDQLLSNLTWSGPARESFETFYSETMREIKKMPETFELYSGFLTEVSDDYNDTFGEIQKNMTELESTIEGSEVNEH